MRRALAAAAAVVVVVVAGAPAGADDEDGPRDPVPLRLDAHLDGDTARFALRYRVHAKEDLEPHYGLPVRGLVTAATVTEGGRRHVLALTPAEQASEAFHALWDKPPGRARTWAVLVSAHVYEGTFSIATAAPRQAALVADVEVVAPTCFHRDARYVAVPDAWRSHVPAGQQVSAKEGEAVDAACGVENSGATSARTWMKFSARALAQRPGGAARIGTYAGRALIGKTNVVKLELNLAARVSDVPADLVTAIVVDASRSMSAEQLEAQRATIDAYLRAAPIGRVQVIEYARHARAVLPSWTTAAQAAPRIARELQALRRKNGSDIAAGLREANRWLDRTSGTRRILLFTDENLTTRAEHTHVLEDALPAATLVHVVALGGEGFERDDEAKLARLAAKTRGLSVRGGDIPFADDKPGKLDATLLVRPITFDRVRVRTPGWKRLETGTACPEGEDELASFDEGAQCTWWGRGDAVAAPFTVEGYLWGERVERVVRTDLGRALEVVRELSAMRVLEEELQALAERAARAVNSVWSLYATWGGDGGYSDEEGLSGFGFGSICGCDGGHIGHATGTGTFGLRPDLSEALARIARTCKPAQAIAIEVETTFEEIVDVAVEASSPETRTCVEEALWSAWLVAPGAPPRTVTRFTVEPA